MYMCAGEISRLVMAHRASCALAVLVYLLDEMCFDSLRESQSHIVTLLEKGRRGMERKQKGLMVGKIIYRLMVCVISERRWEAETEL